MTVRRLKTYAASTGYVYQYYFVGKRPAPGIPLGTEYVFDVTWDRKTTHAVSVCLPAATLHNWARAHGRSLSEAEQYGAVKMRLFQAFDEMENLRANKSLELDENELIAALAVLGLE